MAKHFTRNIRNTKCIGKDIEPLETNEQNDLLNQKPDVFVRNEDYYHCLTNAIQKIDSLSDYINVIKKENSNPVKDKVKVEISAKKLENELKQIQRDLSNIYNIEIAGLKKAIEELNETIKDLDGGNSEELKKKISELENKIDEGLKELKNEIENLEGGGGGVRSSTKVIANYDSHENSKEMADIVINKGENASKKINEAIQTLKGTGGEVKLMEGRYNVKSTIELDTANVTVKGISNATYLVQSDDFQGDELVSISSDIVLKDLKLVGNENVKSHAITLDGECNCELDGLEVTNFSYAGLHGSYRFTGSVTVKGAHISECFQGFGFYSEYKFAKIFDSEFNCTTNEGTNVLFINNCLFYPKSSEDSPTLLSTGKGSTVINSIIKGCSEFSIMTDKTGDGSIIANNICDKEIRSNNDGDIIKNNIMIG